MILGPVGAFVGPIPAAFMRRSAFVAGASQQAAGAEAMQGARTLMDEPRKHPAPTAEPPRTAHRRSTPEHRPPCR